MLNNATPHKTTQTILQQTIIEQTKVFVRNKLENEGTGHDWWHIVRVYNTAMLITKHEPGADIYAVSLAALLHDIADWKFNDGDLTAGSKIAGQWLAGCGVQTDIIEHVQDIIETTSFKGAGVATPMRTLEGQIVQDADRLDAIGAIGIARCFAYGGHKNRPLYNPEQPPVMHANFETYKKSDGTSVNHFYEKLLLLKDRMNTATAKRLAQERHAYMEQFLATFMREWGGRE
jgi:uncharacterized protein